MTQRPCSADELRALFLFEKLTDDQLDWLCQRGRVERFPTGPVYNPAGAGVRAAAELRERVAGTWRPDL